MALESFLLHFRNLRAFLCPSLQLVKVDDILASDFWFASTSEDVSGCRSVFEKRKDDIDKRLAHLSYLRGKYDRNWKVADMVGDIQKAFSQFWEKLKELGKLEECQWFEEVKKLLDEEQERNSDVTES